MPLESGEHLKWEDLQAEATEISQDANNAGANVNVVVTSYSYWFERSTPELEVYR